MPALTCVKALKALLRLYHGSISSATDATTGGSTLTGCKALLRRYEGSLKALFASAADTTTGDPARTYIKALLRLY